MTPKLFSELGLSPELLKGVDQLGFEQASPIQAESIPFLMAGRDLVGQSQTGSGKTAAFAIPAIEKVDVSKRDTQVLILCPTRELAMQVSEEIHKLGAFKRGLHALPVYGGQSYDRQLSGLRQGAHIVIGTPGRVMDHMRRGTLKLENLKMAILDEVDVMLNMGFREDIELILKGTPAARQTVFFSATIPRPIQQLIERNSKNPQQVRIEQKAMTVPTVEQFYYEVDRRYKVDLLTRLIDLHDLKLGIIFCNTKRMVDDLVDHLNAQGYSADRLHGDMTQMMRDRVMQKFRKSGLDFLVATDVAARGIDVDDVEVVFNYDLPYDGEDYVHRIGRTGRKGRSGRAISFASGREIFQIRNIERYTNMRIQRGKPPTAAEVEEARALVFIDKLRATLKSGEFKRYDHLVERLLEEGFVSTDIVSALIHHLQGGEAAAPARPPEDAKRPVRPMAPPPSPAPRPAPLAPRPIPAAPRPAAPVAVTPPAPKPVAPALAPKPISPSPKPVEPTPKVAPAPVKPVIIPRAMVKKATVAAPVKAEAPKPIAPVVEPTPPSPKSIEVETTPPEKPKKKERGGPSFQTRLWINVGEEMGVTPQDIMQSISGQTGLPPETVSAVDIRQRHSFVDVLAEHAKGIIAKLNRGEIKGRRVKVKAA